MVRYRERLWPSAWFFAAGFLVVPAVVLVFAPINLAVGFLVGGALYVGVIALLVASSPTIEVTDRVLRVGSARLPLAVAGDVAVNDTREAARAAAGPGLDARAWLCLRGWVHTSARIEVVDDHDPVPYWLVSTRRPAALRAALIAAKTDATTG